MQLIVMLWGEVVEQKLKLIWDYRILQSFAIPNHHILIFTHH